MFDKIMKVWYNRKKRKVIELGMDANLYLSKTPYCKADTLGFVTQEWYLNANEIGYWRKNYYLGKLVRQVLDEKENTDEYSFRLTQEDCALIARTALNDFINGTYDYYYNENDNHQVDFIGPFAEAARGNFGYYFNDDGEYKGNVYITYIEDR